MHVDQNRELCFMGHVTTQMRTANTRQGKKSNVVEQDLNPLYSFPRTSRAQALGHHHCRCWVPLLCRQALYTIQPLSYQPQPQTSQPLQSVQSMYRKNPRDYNYPCQPFTTHPQPIPRPSSPSHTNPANHLQPIASHPYRLVIVAYVPGPIIIAWVGIAFVSLQGAYPGRYMVPVC